MRNALMSSSAAGRNLCRAAVAALFLLVAAVCPQLHAATSVSEDITASEVWDLAGSPYVLWGEIKVTSGGELVIEPGVRVEFESGSSLRIQGGHVQAQGEPGNPILFTSAQPTPAAGDWGAIAFDNQGDSNPDIIAHAVVEYGEGIDVARSSPILDHLLLRHNDGAAIQVDLHSSPSGSALVATENGLDGIAVPSGQLLGDVHWDLAGIPYVVADGPLTIGQAAMSLSPEILTLESGDTGALTLALSDAAGAGGVTALVSTSVPGVVDTPVSVLVPPGETTTTILLVALAAGTADVSVTAEGIGTANSRVTVVEPSALALQLAATELLIGESTDATVSLVNAAPAGGVSVVISADPAGVVAAPAQVSILEGETTASFTLEAVAEGTATLEASAPGFLTATAQVEVLMPQLSLPSEMVIAPGQSRHVTVSLGRAAAESGLEVELASSDPSVAVVPATVLVGSGDSAADVEVSAGAIGTATISASASGYAPSTMLVKVREIHVQLSPQGNISLPSGERVHRSVRLTQPAPTGGAWVQLELADPNIATLSDVEVFIAEGQTSAEAPIELVGAAEGTTTLVLSSAGLIGTAVDVTVTPQAHLEFSRSSLIVGQGLRSTGESLQLSLLTGTEPYKPEEALEVSLSAGGAEGAIGIAQSVTFDENTWFANLPVSGVALTDQPIQLEAAGQGGSNLQAIMDVAVVAPELEFVGLDGLRRVDGVRDEFQLRWIVPGYSPETPEQVAVDDQDVLLDLIDPEPAHVVPGFEDDAGNSVDMVPLFAGESLSEKVWIGVPASPGSYGVSAEVAGVGAWVSDLQTVMGNAAIEFSEERLVVSRGTRTSAVRVQVTEDGVPVAVTAPLPVTLLSDGAQIGTPTTVTIPTGESGVAVRIDGLALTTASALLNASAPGYAETVIPLRVEVEDPVLDFVDLADHRAPGEARDAFTVRLRDPNPVYPTNPVTITGQTLQVGVTAQDPDDVVLGIENYSGSPLTEILLGGNSRVTSTMYVSSPVHPGSYRVSAAWPGLDANESRTQVVAPLELVFEEDAVAVGHGLYIEYLNVQLRRDGQCARAPAGGFVVEFVSSDPDAVEVPAQATIPANSCSGSISVAAHAATESPVEISAQIPGVASTGRPLAVAVVSPELEFDSWSSYGDGNMEQFSLRWREAKAGRWYYQQYAIEDQIAHLDIVDAFPSGMVSGIEDLAGAPVDSLLIRAGRSNAEHPSTGERWVRTSVPSAPGHYRIRASIDGSGSWLSEPQLVRSLGDPAFVDDAIVVGLGLERYAKLTFPDAQCEELGSSGLPLHLVSSDPVLVWVQDEVSNFDQWECSAQFALRGLGLTSGSTTVSASLSAGGNPVATVPVQVVPPRLVFEDLDDLRSNDADAFRLHWVVPGATGEYGEQQAPFADLEADLEIVDAVPEGVVPGFVDQAGNPITSVSLPAGWDVVGHDGSIRVAPLTGESASGTYRVRATIPSVGSWDSPRQQVIGDDFAFLPGDIAVGRGLASEVTVRRLISGECSEMDSDIELELVSSAAGVIDLPGSVTIPAGACEATVSLEALRDVDDVVSVSIYLDGAEVSTGSSLSVRIAEPVLRIGGLPGVSPIAGSDSDQEFEVWWDVDDPAVSPTRQLAAADQIVALTLVDAVPPTVAGGFVDTWGDPVDHVIIPAGQQGNRSWTWDEDDHPVAVSGPWHAGHYRVRAEASGYDAAVSDRQWVIGDEVMLEVRPSIEKASVATGLTASFNFEVREIGGWGCADAEIPDVQIDISDPEAIALAGPVDAWSCGGSFALTGLQAAEDPVTVTLRIDGVAAIPGVVQVRVVEPELEIVGLSGMRQVGDGRDAFHLSWRVPSDSDYPSPYYGVELADDVTVALSLQDMRPGGVVPGFEDEAGHSITQLIIPAGSSNESENVYLMPATGAGSYKVGLDAEPLGTATSSLQRVVQENLAFSEESLVVGRGLYADSVEIRMASTGACVQPHAARDIWLSSSAPDQVVVPHHLQIPVNACAVAVPVHGVRTTSTPVTITAWTEDGLVAGGLSATVAEPQLIFVGLDGQRMVDGTEDAFGLAWLVPGSEPAVEHKLARDLVVSLETSNAAPADLNPGNLKDRSGRHVRDAVLPAGSGATASDAFHLDPAPEEGTYRLRAAAASGSAWSSDLQTVSPFTLGWSRAQATLGAGLWTESVSLGGRIGGEPAALGTSRIVALNSSDPGALDAPRLIVLPADEVEVPVRLAGTTPGETGVSLSANAAGALAATLSVDVVEPRIGFAELDNNRVVGGEADKFWLWWCIPGDTDPLHHRSIYGDLALVSLESPDPPGLVEPPRTLPPPMLAVQSAEIMQSGGAGPFARIRADRGGSEMLYVPSPALPGSYRIGATVNGGGSWISDLQVVHEAGGRPSGAVHMRSGGEDACFNPPSREEDEQWGLQNRPSPDAGRTVGADRALRDEAAREGADTP